MIQKNNLYINNIKTKTKNIYIYIYIYEFITNITFDYYNITKIYFNKV